MHEDWADYENGGAIWPLVFILKNTNTTSFTSINFSFTHTSCIWKYIYDTALVKKRP